MNINNRQKQALIFFLPTLVSLIIYLLTRSTRLTWANYANDSGDFLAAILTSGVPHPTGYPTYLLMGSLLQLLPVGDPFFRVLLLSIVPTALSAGLLAIIVQRFIFRINNRITMLVSIFSGLVWGLAPFLWSQALIIEVQGLQSLFIVLAFWYCLILFEEPHPFKKSIRLLFLAFCFGLGLGNHVTILFFLPAIIAGNWVATRNGLHRKFVFGQIIMILLASLIYLTLPVRAASSPPINWGNAATWSGFWWLVSGQAYQGLLLNLKPDQILSRISALATILRQQFGIVGVILAVIGAVQYRYQSKLTGYVLLYLFATYSIFAIIYGTDDSIVYLLPAFLVVVVWLASAWYGLLNWQIGKRRFAYALMVLVLIIFVFSIPATWREVDARSKGEAADYAEMTLGALPHDAIILTSADPDSFPLWYYHFGLKQRSDIAVVVLPLTQFAWYQQTLIHNYPEIQFPEPIGIFTNKSQNWGEKIAPLNQERTSCRSTIVRGEKFSIRIFCSDGKTIEFLNPSES